MENQSRYVFFKDVNKETNNPTDYLFTICKHSKINLQSIQLLVDNKADLNALQNEISPFHWACHNKNATAEIIKFLIQKSEISTNSSDPFLPDFAPKVFQRNTALHSLCRETKFFNAVQLLIEKLKEGYKNHFYQVETYLKKQNAAGDTALHLLCKHQPRPLELMAFLINAAGADANLKNQQGKTVYDLIPERDRKRLKELLVSKEHEKTVSNSFK